MDPQQLQDILIYKSKVLEQFLAVSSIFGGFAVTGVIAMRAEAHRDRIHSLAFGATAIAAVAFIFATALDAIWLPVSHLSKLRSAIALQAVLDTGDSVVWAIMIGAVSLIVAVGLFGFSRSRKMGVFVLTLAILAAVAFVINARILFVATAGN